MAGASFTYSQNNSTGSSGGSTTAVSVAASGTWTGSVEAAINQSYLVVGVNSTQNGTLTVYQYIDNAGLVLELPVNTFSITANTPYSTTLAVDGNYVKVAFANNSGTTAATVYVDSYYGPLPVAPESLTQSGNFKVAVQEPLPSGTNAIGTVGVTSAPAAAAVTVTPTNTVGAYTAGQCVGGLITLANVGQGTTFGALLQSVQLAAKINYTGGFNITFFGSAPSTTFTDKATPTFNLSDVPKIVAYATITGYNQGLGTNYAVYANYYLGASVQLASSTLYAVITCVGAPTFATTTDLTLSVGTL